MCFGTQMVHWRIRNYIIVVHETESMCLKMFLNLSKCEANLWLKFLIEKTS
jgi:hypothetical protein